LEKRGGKFCKYGGRIVNANMAVNFAQGNDYKVWLEKIKQKVRAAQIKAVIKVNAELLAFYWELGVDIVLKQKKSKWGDGVLAQLSRDLAAEFRDIKGFSLSNLKYIKQWYLFYSRSPAFSQQLVGQITQIPWGHNIVIMSKCKNVKEALYYVQNTLIQKAWVPGLDKCQIIFKDLTDKKNRYYV